VPKDKGSLVERARDAGEAIQIAETRQAAVS
jgi:hypothetical protein